MKRTRPHVLRRSSLAALAVGSTLLLSACVSNSGGGQVSTAGSSLAPDQKVSLTFASYAFQAPTVAATDKIVADWNAANPNIQVTVQKVAAESVHDKLVTQFAGNQAPDIIHDESADIASFSRQGYLADMTSMVPADLKSDVPQSVWDSVTYDGKITGMPTIAQVYTIFVNKKLLAAAGVAVPTAEKPWTWDDLAANAKKLTAGTVSGLAWGLKSPTAGIMSSGLAFDGTFVSGDEKAPTMAVGANEQQVPNRIAAMLADGSMAKDSVSLSGSDVLAGYYGGKYAMIMAGNYIATQVEEQAPADFDWGMLPLLKGTSEHQASNPQTLSIAQQSKYPAQAMQFIAFFMKAENLAAIAEGDALIPVTASASAAMGKKLGAEHGWDAILGSADQLVDAPWNKADKFPDWKSKYATPAYQEFLAGRTDAAGLATALTDGWKTLSGG
ncbi:MAG: sugar ABC transporter substrate-binding protein [Nakamurella sp.]